MTQYHRFPHIYLTDDRASELMEEIAICREPTCPVAQRHPFFPTPDDPPLYHGRRPCSPVVPTHLAHGQVMLIGSYPNCRYASYPVSGSGRTHFLPVDNINEPFEGGRYWDGFGTRDYPTAGSLRDNYLEPLGLDLERDVWLTNLVKCFLMDDRDVERYVEAGWIQGGDTTVAHTRDDYFDVAEVCWRRHLEHEIEACQPSLIITFGGKLLAMLHGHNTLAGGDPPGLAELAGVPLPAGAPASGHDTRIEPFRSHNVIHFYHPSYLLLPHSGGPETRQIHRHTHVPNALEFRGDIACAASDVAAADAHFRRAIAIIEEHRAEVPNAQERIDALTAKLGC